MSRKFHFSEIVEGDDKITINARVDFEYLAGSARHRWYKRLIEFNGKSLAEFKTSVRNDPPSLPASGQPEPICGWLRFFDDAGVFYYDYRKLKRKG